jgi:acyl-CoA synthetase (AMP-forming)/AMP-acid ligase II
VRRPTAVVDRLTSSLALKAGTVVDFRNVTPFGWRQVCIVAPKTPLTIVRDSLRLPTDSEVTRGIERRGDIDLLVFRFEHVPPASLVFPRQSGGFASQASGQAAFANVELGKEVVLAFLPFFHIYGQVVIMLGSLLQRNLLVLFTTPDTEAILAAMERYQATVFYGVPTLYEYLRDHKDTDKANWRRLKLLVSGADTLHESTMQGWSKRTGSLYRPNTSTMRWVISPTVA